MSFLTIPSKIFESAGADLNRQLLETGLYGSVNLLLPLVAMWQVDKLVANL